MTTLDENMVFRAKKSPQEVMWNITKTMSASHNDIARMQLKMKREKIEHDPTLEFYRRPDMEEYHDRMTSESYKVHLMDRDAKIEEQRRRICELQHKIENMERKHKIQVTVLENSNKSYKERYRVSELTLRRMSASADEWVQKETKRRKLNFDDDADDDCVFIEEVQGTGEPKLRIVKVEGNATESEDDNNKEEKDENQTEERESVRGRLSERLIVETQVVPLGESTRNDELEEITLSLNETLQTLCDNQVGLKLLEKFTKCLITEDVRTQLDQRRISTSETFYNFPTSIFISFNFYV